jgi:hypothetical protein
MKAFQAATAVGFVFTSLSSIVSSVEVSQIKEI